jgi:hypothetical protein
MHTVLIEEYRAQWINDSPRSLNMFIDILRNVIMSSFFAPLPINVLHVLFELHRPMYECRVYSPMLFDTSYSVLWCYLIRVIVCSNMLWCALMCSDVLWCAQERRNTQRQTCCLLTFIQRKEASYSINTWLRGSFTKRLSIIKFMRTTCFCFRSLPFKECHMLDLINS